MPSPGQRRNPVVAYAFAHASKTLFWSASDIFFAFYLTEVCGLPALSMGWVLAGSYLVNAAADWLLGRRLAAVVRTARGAARFQFAGAVASSAILLLFALAALVPPPLRLGASLTALIAFRLAYSLYDIPQNSLLALAGQNDRARLAASRLFVSGLARIALTASFTPLFVRRTTEAQIEAFLILVVIMAVLGVVSAAALVVDLRRATAPLPTATATKASRRPPIRLHVMMMALSLGTTVFTQLEPYLAAFALASRWRGAALMTAVAIGTSLSQPVWMMIDARLPRERVAVLALSITAAGALAFPVLALNGAVAVAGVGTVYGAGVGGLFFLLWTGIARQAAYTHEARGASATLGAFSGSAKLGQSAAILGVGAYLQAIESKAPAMSGPWLVWMMSGAVLASLGLLAALAVGHRLNALAGSPSNNIRQLS